MSNGGGDSLLFCELKGKKDGTIMCALGTI